MLCVIFAKVEDRS